MLIENKMAKRKIAESDYSSTKSYNRIGDEVWFLKQLKIVNEVTGTNPQSRIYFADLSESERHWVQTLLLGRYPYTDAFGALSYPFTTVYRYAQAGRSIMRFLRAKTDEKQFLRNWSNSDLTDFLQQMAIKSDGKIVSMGAMREIFLVLTDSYSIRHNIDGISVPLHAAFFSKALRGFIESKGYLFHDWLHPARQNLMPCSIATLLLADAIRTIRSKTTEVVKVYFECIGKERLSAQGFYLRAQYFSNFDEFVPYELGENSKRSSRSSAPERLNFVKRIQDIDSSITALPFCSYHELSKAVEHIMGACIAILLAITGMRIGELQSLRADQVDYTEFFDSNTKTWRICDAVMYSKIIKTGGGIVAKRSISPLGIEVFDLINRLSWIDKKDQGLLLFEPTYKSVKKCLNGTRKKTGIASVILRWRFQEYYEDFISRAHESVGSAYPHAKPHDLRHFKAAFALRKFDGAVDEVEAALRQDFRHHSHHTQAYTLNKLSEQDRAFVKRDFVSDIVRRILTGTTNDRWIGPGISKLRAAAKKVLDEQSMELVSVEELAELVDTLGAKIHSLTLHSYGACIVIADQVQTAKCGTKHNIVQTGNARSEVCYGCSNFGLSKICHQREVSLNKRRWQEVSNDPTLSRFKLNENAVNIVKKLEEFEKELEMAG